MADTQLQSAIATIPPGAWCVGVSGGADSLAMLFLLRSRAELRLHVAHVNHETRGRESDEDAQFVDSLCARWQLPCTIQRLTELQPELERLPANPSARFRFMRFELFRRVVANNALDGVVLAHHADDQAETVLQRLLRSSEANGLSGMSARARIGDLVVLRPMLGVRGQQLRSVLKEVGQPWREDSSNKSRAYLRNRLRLLLSRNVEVTDALLDLSKSCRDLRDWARRVAPTLEPRFPAASLARLPAILARESAKRWLRARGLPHALTTAASMARLIEMATDAATPARHQFSGSLVVGRRAGWIAVAGS